MVPSDRVPTLTVVSVATAAALVPLSSTMIAVALPHIARDFGISRSEAGILITVYLVAMLAGQPVAGRISDRFGARGTGLVALMGFGACCVVAMLAPTFPTLVAARAGQAAFASALTPSVQSVLRAITPPGQRGRVFGLFGSALAVGAAAGPVIGGLLIAAVGWHGIFAVNLPVVAVALVVFWRLDPMLTRVVERARARGRTFNRTFTTAYGNQALTTLAQYTLLLVVPVVLDDRGWSSVAVGLMLSSLTIGVVAMSPIGGRLGDRRGYRPVILAGTAAAAGALLASALLGPDLPAAVLVLALGGFGVGLGLATPGITTIAIESVPAERSGLAAGVLSTSRYVGSITSSVALSVLLGEGTDGVASMLWIALVAVVLATAVAALLPARPMRRGLVREGPAATPA